MLEICIRSVEHLHLHLPSQDDHKIISVCKIVDHKMITKLSKDDYKIISVRLHLLLQTYHHKIFCVKS